MAHQALVIREGTYDQILTPLAFAYLGAASGQEVDVLFVNWAVRVLTAEGVDDLPMSAEHADEGPWLEEQVAAAGLPTKVSELLRALHGTGRVHLYACTLAAQIFGVTEDNLIPEAEFLPANEFMARMEKAPVTMTL